MLHSLFGGFFFDACGIGLTCLAEACCWYHFFQKCGCIEDKHERLPEEKPVPKVQAKAPNPFINTGMPKDTHLQPAYGV